MTIKIPHDKNVVNIVLAAIFLPETINRPLPDTLPDKTWGLRKGGGGDTQMKLLSLDERQQQDIVVDDDRKSE
jgi:hypothetical protein